MLAQFLGRRSLMALAAGRHLTAFRALENAGFSFRSSSSPSLASLSAPFGSSFASPTPASVSPATQLGASTVYALSSGAGRAGVAVIRLTGPESLHALQRMLGPASSVPAARRAAVRRLYHPVTGDFIDRAMVLACPGPASFTGEDVVELHVHGGPSVVSGALEALQCMESSLGMASAGAGDFTRRAFSNGKMDLTAVEGLADLLEAETEAQRRQALRQMDGELGNLYERWRTDIVHCLAHTEAVIDFADDETTDDVDEGAFAATLPRVQALRHTIQGHLRDGHRGEILRSGMRVALLGPPNAGKSSLLNVLARRPAAIVSPFAGTTRDVVQVRFCSCSSHRMIALRITSGACLPFRCVQPVDSKHALKGPGCAFPMAKLVSERKDSLECCEWSVTTPSRTPSAARQLLGCIAFAMQYRTLEASVSAAL